MKSKTVRRKKVKGFFYFNKRLIFPSILLIIALLTFIFLPDKQKPNNDCANSISCINDLSGTYQEVNSGVFHDSAVNVPALALKPYIAQLAATDNVLGETTTDSKHIYIDLGNQHLYAFENNNLIYNFPVSTGKWYPTPTGDFRIWIKLRYTRMTGGNKAIGTYYDLPNVPYTMYFYNSQYPKTRGYGIHGAYWHNNFGHPMSHGCVNMSENDVAQLYAWANPQITGNATYATENNPGTPVTIYGVTPIE